MENYWISSINWCRLRPPEEHWFPSFSPLSFSVYRIPISRSFSSSEIPRCDSSSSSSSLRLPVTDEPLLFFSFLFSFYYLFALSHLFFDVYNCDWCVRIWLEANLNLLCFFARCSISLLLSHECFGIKIRGHSFSVCSVQ